MPQAFHWKFFGKLFLIAATLYSQPLQCSDLSALFTALERPELLKTNMALQTWAQELISAYAPKYWFDTDDVGPSDPLQFIFNSSLWFRKPGTADRMMAERGSFGPLDLPLVWNDPGPARPSDSLTGQGLYLRYERYENSGATTNRSPTASAWEGTPVLWRLGARIRDDLFIIEYWFHSDFSRGGPFGLGAHQGDWEGVAALVRAGFPEPEVFTHRLIAMYFAAHNRGSWTCAQDMEWTRDENGQLHPEAFAALGSHATYSKPGSHWNRMYWENASRGRPWNTWKTLRPLVLEPYFGFSGGWGQANIFAFRSGPMPPSSFKKMPNENLPSCPSRPTSISSPRD